MTAAVNIKELFEQREARYRNLEGTCWRHGVFHCAECRQHPDRRFFVIKGNKSFWKPWSEVCK